MMKLSIALLGFSSDSLIRRLDLKHANFMNRVALV